MKAIVYKFCGKTILQVGDIPNIIADRMTILHELDIDAIHVELNKMKG
ncbi:MAG: hypothetical protein II825_09415 [Paludibacteraceae bacterium]|nr:hypothetical protein [Paludibacteraceae bacterium]